MKKSYCHALFLALCFTAVNATGSTFTCQDLFDTRNNGGAEAGLRMIKQSQTEAITDFYNRYGMEAIKAVDNKYWQLNSRSNPKHFTAYMTNHCSTAQSTLLTDILYQYYHSIYTNKH